jgi:type VII secretion protein EccB
MGVTGMHNRRDQVHAHGFMVGRLVSALLRAEPDLATPPLRRSWSGLIIGALLAALGVAGFAVMAFILPGGATGWRKPGALVLDKGTGSRFVLAQGRLRPVLNYASARLLLGEKLKVAAVSSSSISGVPRGGPIGIVGAPDSLPAKNSTARPWLACASSAGSRPELTLVIGADDGARPLSPRQVVLVRTSDGTTYLVTGGRRFRVTASWVTRALGIPDGVGIVVRDAWVNTVPAGPDLPQPLTSGLGGAGPAIDGQPTRVGQVFAARGSDLEQRFYLLTTGGLRPMSRTEAALTLSDPQTAKAYDGRTATARDLSPAALAGSALLPAASWPAQLPVAPPALNAVTGGRMPCVRTLLSGNRADSSVVTLPAASASGANAASLPSGATSDSGRIADRVAVAPKAGLLTRTLPAPGVPGEGLYLVTEEGAKYPVQNEAAATALGYSLSSAIGVPADLLALLPSGPVLHMLGSGGDG